MRGVKSKKIRTIDKHEELSLRNVRNSYAELLHQNLLNNSEALDFQTTNRGHSLESLKSFQVGVAGRDDIALALENGTSIEDLIKIGAVRRSKTGYTAVIRPGMYVYPHKKDGDVLYFSLKDPVKKYKHQLKKGTADSEWVCLNQDSLNESKIIIAEGEDDLLSIYDRGKQSNVIATIGNFNTPNILEYLKHHAKGKTFYLGFDRDDAGKKYTSKYSDAIIEGGGGVYVILIPEPHNDIDEFLRFSKDPEKDCNQLLKKALRINKPINKEEKYFDIGSFESFQSLGELQDERIAIWSKINRKIYKVSINDLNLDKFVQIGGKEVSDKLARKSSDGKIPFRLFKQVFIAEASKKQLGDPEYLGQGIHLLRNGKILIVNGGEAFIWDDKNFICHDSPIIDGKFIEWTPGSKWIDINEVIKKMELIKKENAEQTFDKLFNLIAQFGFKGQLAHVVLCGAFLAQIVQSIWDWRPHIWISGSQGSGKTLLTILFEKLGGKLLHRYEGQGSSEAGIRQDIGSDSALIIVDEFEKTQHRDKILELCRSASRGGHISKGSANHKKVKFRIRHMFLLCSIEVGLHRAAESSRYLVLETLKSPSRNPKIPSGEEVDQLRLDIFAYAIWASLKAKKLIPQVKAIKGVDRRFVESLAVVFSPLVVAADDPLKDLNGLIEDYIAEWIQLKDGAVLEDEQKVLEDLMTANIKLPIIQENSLGDQRITYDFRTVSQLVKSSKNVPEHYVLLQTHGIRVREDGLFIHPDKARRILLQNTDWYNLNIKEIILRLPGAMSVRDRLANSQVRGVFIPYASLLDYCEVR